MIFDAYAREWMANRSLRPRTRETYDSKLRHFLAQFGRAELRVIKPGDVRNWLPTVPQCQRGICLTWSYLNGANFSRQN